MNHGEDFFHLDKQNYCFPDLSFLNKEKNLKIHLEIFHRWHSGQLQKRLQFMKDTQPKNLIIGICNSLAKNKEIKKLLDDVVVLKKHTFTFSDFPTSNKITKILSSF